MPHRPGIFSKGFISRKAIPSEDCEYGRPSRTSRPKVHCRPTLSSLDSLSQMAIESSKARLVQPLITQMVERCPNEFGSSFRSSSRCGPFSITSHTDRIPSPKISSVTPKVTQIQNCVTTAPSSSSDFDDKAIFICKCKKCTNQRCPSKTVCKKKIVFDGVVQTICDGVTMTTKLVDAECDGSPMCSRNECGTNPAAVIIRNIDESAQVQAPYSRPTTLLEKNTSSMHFEYAYRRPTEKVYIEERTKESIGCQCRGQELKYEEPEPLEPLECFYRRIDPPCMEPQYNEQSCSGVTNLYNDGISDRIASQIRESGPCSYPRHKIPKCTNLGSRIPYSHRYPSKYHQNCKHYKDNNYIFEDEDEDVRPPRRCLNGCPRNMRRACAKLCPPFRAPPNIQLPKRVLTSDRNIDEFMSKRRCAYPKCPNTFGVQAVLLM